MTGSVPPAPPPPAADAGPRPSSKLVAAGFACCALGLIIPPLGLAAIAIGIVLIVRGRIGPGVAILLLGIVLPFIGAVIFQALIARPYRVPSGSMEPTLKIGERVVADRTGLSSPGRGDIVVFHPPAGADNNLNGCGVPNFEPQTRGQPCPRPTDGESKQLFIKRIVAVPGDHIRIERGRVVLNGKLQKEPFIHPDELCDVCNLPKEITIGPGHFFMLGDNRGASIDSRFWGPVPEGSIVGKVGFAYWPLNRFGPL
jgi:signal peptidase I